MKNRIFLLLLACGFMSLLASSCIDDKGNYEYEDAGKILPVTISAISDTAVILGDVLRIEPEVQNANNEDYAYSWYVIPPVSTSGSVPRKTILSDERILDIPIKLDVGSYYLYFEVRDINRDIYVRQQALLSVEATNITIGWYVLKDIDNETDFDYISQDGSIRESDVILNRSYPFVRLKGRAISIVYQSQRYYHQVTNAAGVVTTLTNQRALHIVSSEDVKTLNARTMELFKNFEDEFYFPPENCRPQAISAPPNAYGDMFLLNDGKVQSIYGMMANIGKFSAPRVGLYSMHKDMIATNTMMSNALFFDTESSSFYTTSSYGSDALQKLREESATAPNPIGVSPNNMPYTLLNLLPRNVQSYSATGYAVMKDKNSDDYYLAGINYLAGTPYPFTSFRAIPEECQMPEAEVKAAPYSGSFIYFGVGNELWVYRDAEGLSVRETLLKTFPAGETISYIVHHNPTSDNLLIVLTNSAAGWKMYAYKMIGLGNPEFEEDPVITYSGTGNARYVMYRAS